MCMCVCVHVHVHACVCTCMCMCVCMCMCERGEREHNGLWVRAQKKDLPIIIATYVHKATIDYNN